MDNVTHAIAGLLLAEVAVAHLERRTGQPASAGVRRAAAVVGVVAAELPDADLLYAGPVLGMGKLGYLLHHRGHTHTVAFALVAALLVWGLALLVRPSLRARPVRGTLLALAMAGTLVAHLTLDFTNNYGVHPWWPVSNRWHYGDAVFIVEPWLWVAALPPLALLARSVTSRVGYVLALLLILAAAWTVDMVGPGVALALTLGAATWGAVAWRAPGTRRVGLALAGWVAVEALFFAASHRARAHVRAAVAEGAPAAAYEGAALTPAIGNPLCFSGLVMERDDATYRVTRTAVATLPGVRSVVACERGGASLASRPGTDAVRWGEAWSAPVAELVALARENCEVAAALRFIRVPTWERLPDGTVRVSDLRYDRGGGGFAEIVSPAIPSVCPAHVPPWEPPRHRLLEAPVGD